MAGLLARGSLPSAAFPGNSQWHRRGLVAYSCGGSAGVESSRFENARTGFPFHLPRGRTIADDASGQPSRGQPGQRRCCGGVDLMAAVASGRRMRKGNPMTSDLKEFWQPPPIAPLDPALAADMRAADRRQGQAAGIVGADRGSGRAAGHDPASRPAPWRQGGAAGVRRRPWPHRRRRVAISFRRDGRDGDDLSGRPRQRQCLRRRQQCRRFASSMPAWRRIFLRIRT